jgi:L-lactate utilization protein LutB
MSEFRAWHNQIVGNKTAEALEKRNFKATYAATRQEAIEKILEIIPIEASIGVGGSETINEIGILKLLSERGNIVYNHNKPGLSKEESLAIRHQQLQSDVFLTGSNAVTMEGELVNVDGTGNRVSAMVFGPKKVIVIAGVNKIVPDCAAAIERVKLVAAPINNKRRNFQNPCVISGRCVDCHGPTRICNITTIMHRKPGMTDVHVFIIGEELGF